MRKFLHSGLVWFFVLPGFLFNACEKQKTYDLFPLKAGNQFYYKYYWYRSNGSLSDYLQGTEKWEVISEKTEGNYKIYMLERRLNGVHKTPFQTKIISDSLRYLYVSEEISSSVLSSDFVFYEEISFKRYQNVPQAEIKHGVPQDYYWCYLFKADSGLTKFINNDPPIQITELSLTLDSVKINP